MKNRVIAYIKAKHNRELIASSMSLGDSKQIIVQYISDDVISELGFGRERFEIETGIEIDELVKSIFENLRD